MLPALTLWTHALAALLLGLVALAQIRRPSNGLPRAAFIAALSATALWALAFAGLDARDITTRIAEGIRDLSWLALLYSLVRRERHRTPAMRWLVAVYCATAVVLLVTIGLAIAQQMAGTPAGQLVIGETLPAMRLLGGVAALLLAHHLQTSGSGAPRDDLRLTIASLSAMIAGNLTIDASQWITGAVPVGLWVARGVLLIALAPLFSLAGQRGGEWTLRVSRSITFQSLSLLAIGGYVLVTVGVTAWLARVGGAHVRVIQTAFVFGTTVALGTLLATPWLRAWVKVLVAKHLFSHRYDYRHEWLRFTETLGQPGEGAPPLAARVVQAVADVTDSPAGLLLVARDRALERVADWKWDDDTGHDSGTALLAHLADTSRIIELDAVRAGTADQGDIDATPNWLIQHPEAWVIVPLVHFTALGGAIVLARPPISRPLDWEDFDLLGVAGRQVATYLAEDRAHDALADAQRFDEFNRRFAFIMHDLKNMVSQLTLVARNAERHAENPAFRADMVATLQESADRMNTLLARLSQQRGTKSEPVRAVPLLELVRRIAQARRAQHAVKAVGAADAVALADPASLETLIAHLVQNAIEADSRDAVVLEVHRDDDGRTVSVDVTDHGSGMSPTFIRDHLFKPFASSKSDGFGLGAFEARQLAEAMSGTIAVTSREGEGTRFRITLPAAPAMENVA